jgi:hypothetical protein
MCVYLHVSLDLEIGFGGERRGFGFAFARRRLMMTDDPSPSFLPCKVTEDVGWRRREQTNQFKWHNPKYYQMHVRSSSCRPPQSNITPAYLSRVLDSRRGGGAAGVQLQLFLFMHNPAPPFPFSASAADRKTHINVVICGLLVGFWQQPSRFVHWILIFGTGGMRNLGVIRI